MRFADTLPTLREPAGSAPGAAAEPGGFNPSVLASLVAAEGRGRTARRTPRATGEGEANGAATPQDAAAGFAPAHALPAPHAASQDAAPRAASQGAAPHTASHAEAGSVHGGPQGAHSSPREAGSHLATPAPAGHPLATAAAAPGASAAEGVAQLLSGGSDWTSFAADPDGANTLLGPVTMGEAPTTRREGRRKADPSRQSVLNALAALADDRDGTETDGPTEPEVTLEARLEAAAAEARAEAEATAQIELAAARADERAAADAALAAAREAWAAETAAALDTALDAGFDKLHQRLSDAFATALKPIAEAALRDQAVRRFASVLDDLLSHDAPVPAVTVTGPQHLLTALEPLVRRHGAVAMKDAPGIELRATLAQTQIETIIGAWAEDLSAAFDAAALPARSEVATEPAPDASAEAATDTSSEVAAGPAAKAAPAPVSAAPSPSPDVKPELSSNE